MLDDQEEMRKRLEGGKSYTQEGEGKGNGKFELREVLDLGVELSTKYRENFMNMEKEIPGENALTLN